MRSAGFTWRPPSPELGKRGEHVQLQAAGGGHGSLGYVTSVQIDAVHAYIAPRVAGYVLAELVTGLPAELLGLIGGDQSEEAILGCPVPERARAVRRAPATDKRMRRSTASAENSADKHLRIHSCDLPGVISQDQGGTRPHPSLCRAVAQRDNPVGPRRWRLNDPTLASMLASSDWPVS